MKKNFTYPIFVVLFLSFIGMMGFGAIVKYNLEGKKEYKLLQKTVMFIVEVPFSLKKIIRNRTFNIDKPDKLQKYKDKKRYKQFIKNERNALLVLPRYDHSLSRSVIDIIDLNHF